MRYRVAIFDFDGTLVDTSLPIVRSVRAALSQAGRPPPPEARIRRCVGLPLHDVFDRLTEGRCAPAEIERFAEHYKARFDEEAPGRTRLFAGVADALRRLARAGVRLAIATNRGRRSLVMILEEHGLQDLFAYLVTAHCVEHGKPHPQMVHRVLEHFAVDPRTVLMVGDTTIDVRMGRAAGIDTCAVTYGAHSAEELRREKPTHCVHRAAELPAVAEVQG